MIDLRSDTVTRPSPEMLDAMRNADTGDDVYGEDPTVNELEALIAKMTGKDAALFVSSGTQGNLLALLCHCQRGDEYIAGHDAHTYQFEAGGGAVLGGIQPQPVPFNTRGELPLAEVERAIKPDDPHFARTRLVCLENTKAGMPLDMAYLADYSEVVTRHNLARHLDGARVFNAAVKLGVGVDEIARHFDTVSICLSKGLAAPVGSLLVGDSDTIARAKRWRKMLGGGMRQAGVIAAAGIYALNHHVERLADDHHHAALLAAGIRDLPGFKLAADPETNMVLLDLPPDDYRPLKSFLQENGVTTSGQRWVMHRDIDGQDVEHLIALCTQYADQQS